MNVLYAMFTSTGCAVQLQNTCINLKKTWTDHNKNHREFKPIFNIKEQTKHTGGKWEGLDGGGGGGGGGEGGEKEVSNYKER